MPLCLFFFIFLYILSHDHLESMQGLHWNLNKFLTLIHACVFILENALATSCGIGKRSLFAHYLYTMCLFHLKFHFESNVVCAYCACENLLNQSINHPNYGKSRTWPLVLKATV